MKKLEYIWLDGFQPEPSLRSKVKVTDRNPPDWSFDGSSTQQAEGGSSDCILKPVNEYRGPRSSDSLVTCEGLAPDKSPHPAHTRNACVGLLSDDWWFGFEQEYFIMDTATDLPLGFPVGGYPGPQGLYYCSVGGKNTHGRDLVEEHADQCIEAGLNFEGINQEVASGQWEFQLFAKGAKKAGDEIWIGRDLLDRLTER